MPASFDVPCLMSVESKSGKPESADDDDGAEKSVPQIAEAEEFIQYSEHRLSGDLLHLLKT
jgi:hypothetical protein